MDPTLLRNLPFSVPILVIASVVLVSVLAWLIRPLRRFLILSPHRVWTRWEIHRLLTAGWLHSDLGHLAFNMLTLYFFADRVLRVLGPTRFLVLYVSAVIVAFVPTTLRHRHHPEYGSLGASGAVAAVMFSAVLLIPNLKLYLMFVPVPVSGIVFAVAYLVYSVVHSYMSKGNVNHSAHFFGAVYGAALTYAFEPALVRRTLQSLWSLV